MKKIPLIFLIFLSSFISKAQFLNSFGINSGISFTNQHVELYQIDYKLETKTKIGFYTEVFLERTINEKFAFSVNFGYQQKGSCSDFYGYAINHIENNEVEILKGDDYKFFIDYFSFYPLIIYKLNFQHFDLLPFIGPRIDILSCYSTDSQFGKPDCNKLIAGLTAGAELQYTLSRFAIGVECKEMIDFTNAVNANGLKIRNNAFNVGLKLKFFIHQPA